MTTQTTNSPEWREGYNAALEDAAGLIKELERYTLSKQYEGNITDFQASVNQGIRMSTVHFNKLSDEICHLKTRVPS